MESSQEQRSVPNYSTTLIVTQATSTDNVYDNPSTEVTITNHSSSKGTSFDSRKLMSDICRRNISRRGHWRSLTGTLSFRLNSKKFDLNWSRITTQDSAVGVQLLKVSPVERMDGRGPF